MEEIDIDKLKIKVTYSTFMSALNFLKDVSAKVGIDYDKAFNGEGLELDDEKFVPKLIEVLQDDFDQETMQPGDVADKLFVILSRVTRPNIPKERLVDELDLFEIAELFLRIFLHFKGANINENFMLKRIMSMTSAVMTDESSTTATDSMTPPKKRKLKKKATSKD